MPRNKYVLARRSVWYFLKCALMLVFVATLAVGITITALYISNMYIVVTEGMELRAECILQNGPKLELTKFFTEDYLKQDALLNYNTQEEPLGGNPYDPWTITNYDYRLSVESVFVLPWSNKGSMTVLERIPSISGTSNESADSKEGPPKWIDARYEFTLEYIDDRWLITSIKTIEENPPVEEKPTPDMSMLGEEYEGGATDD